MADALRPSPKAFRHREIKPVLGTLAGLDSRAAAAAASAAINTITAFSGRFSGPVFFSGAVRLSSFLVSSLVSEQTNVHVYAHEHI